VRPLRLNPSSPIKLVLTALLPFALHGLARALDHSLGLLLHTSLDVPNLVPLALGLMDPFATLRAVVAWSLAGALLWIVLAAWHSRSLRPGLPALTAVAGVFAPLYLRPALTLMALAALAWQPSYPYGFTLPVALTQDWGLAQDLASVAALAASVVALRRDRPSGRAAALSKIPWAPRTWEVGFVAFLGFALLTPERARLWDGHPGNEPKYLRMAVALGHFGSLDVTRVDGPMEELPTTPISTWLSAALRRAASDSRAFMSALAAGRAAWRPEAVMAVPQAHLTVLGPDDGAYHVLAPGPSLLLAPALRLDREINRARGTPARLAVALLVWNGLAAALLAALFGLALEAGARPLTSAVVALATALSPPLLFYFYQFYPEVPAALLLVLALRGMLFSRGPWGGARLLGLGLTLMPLPWLHQKYLPVWLALTLLGVVIAVVRMVTVRALLALIVPQAATLALTLYYNFALTGSPRPDALFRALGRTGVAGDTLGQGALGLVLDARYGILPYVPWLLLALGGAALASAQMARLRVALAVAAVYYLTVAAATNWTGSISNLGRFVLPLVPLVAVLVPLVLERIAGRPGMLAFALTLAAWSGVLAVCLWRDPLAANDSGLLLARASFADGNVYLPNLLLRRWADAAPGLWAQLVAWGLLMALAAWFLRAAANGAGGRSPVRLLTGLVATLLVLGLCLEHWPSARRSAVFESLRLDDRSVLIVHGPARVDGDTIVAEPGRLELVLRTQEQVRGIELLGPQTRFVGFDVFAELQGRRGNRETLAHQILNVEQATTFQARCVR
jgi:hypothetical protein